ncbi:MAG: histidine kinase [Bacteroidota bacterium]
MKKAFLLVLVFISAVAVGYAQVKKSKPRVMQPADDNKYIHFDGYQDHPPYGIGSVQEGVMDTRIYDIFRVMKEAPNAAEWNKAHPLETTHKFIPKTPILLGVKFTAKGYGSFATNHINAISKDYLVYKFANRDSVSATLAMGINRGNVKDFRYHVVLNDSVELVPWSIPKLQQLYGAKTPYAYFGKYHAPGKMILIEVVNVKDYSLRDGLVFDWRNDLKPALSHITVFARHGKYHNIDINDDKKDHGYTTGIDKQTNLPLNFHFPDDSILSMNIFFKSHPTVAYDVYCYANNSYEQSDIEIKGGLTDSTFFFDRQYFPLPGKYQLLVYPAGTRRKEQETKIEFEVMGPSKAKVTILQLLPYIIAALLLFIIYYLYNKRRLKKLDQQKEMANLKLGSVRAQLNPHFMFNALTSIQNLMNQQDSAGANHYLAKFADLTRQVLNATGRELISLEDELKIINDYLQIEQLRFGFNYTVDVDKSINIANTEVPGMLMQPFIENAAKHGISGMGDMGKIDIAIAKKQNNLVLIIADNGKGFDAQQTTSGFGLKLGRERVALLNQIYKTQTINMQIDSGAKGTTVTITLTAWF